MEGERPGWGLKKKGGKVNLLAQHAEIAALLYLPSHRPLPYCNSHIHPEPRPPIPPLPQLALSRKINDLQVQAQRGARVNLARVGEMF